MEEQKEGAFSTRGEGIIFDSAKGEYSPPITEETLPEEVPPPELKKVKLAKVPLMPATIRLAFRIPGELLAWKTNFDGWKLSEEDLADIVEVYEALGIELDPRIQALIIPAAAYGERWAAYELWKRAGKPIKEKVAGAAPEKVPEGR